MGLLLPVSVSMSRKRTGPACTSRFLCGAGGGSQNQFVEFSNFCIDGLHFTEDGTGDPNPENTYVNGKTGIYVASPHDSFRINGMGLVYLEHGLTLCQANALSVHDNFIAECGSCIELRGWGQASKVTDNLIGAGYKGYSIYAENFGGLLISSNHILRDHEPWPPCRCTIMGLTTGSAWCALTAATIP